MHFPFAKKYITSPHPKGSFYSIFCEKIVSLHLRAGNAVPMPVFVLLFFRGVPTGYHLHVPGDA
jgi:hypothetical protein